MTEEPVAPKPSILSEQLAHRVLARAVELDVVERSGTPLSRLREVAREIGISDAAFDAALAEVRANTVALPSADGHLRRWWRRVLGADTGRSWGQAAVINAGAFAVFWTALGLASRLTYALDVGWELQAGLFVAVNLGAFELARRLRARPVAFVLAVTAIAQLAEYVIHLLFGIKSAQGGGTHFAVLLAAGLGIALTHLLQPSPPAIEAETQPVKPMSREGEPPQWSLFRAAEPRRRGLGGAVA